MITVDNVDKLTTTLQESMEKALINADGVNVMPISLPSGDWAIIREQNGDDDGILSNKALQKDASSLNMFVASIVVYSPKATNKLGILTLQEVLDMPIRDKYVIIIKSRIFSMGDVLEFSFTWDTESGLTDHYDEDLNRFIWDYTNAFPEEGNEKYDIERVAPYPLKPDAQGYIYLDTTGKASSIPLINTTEGVKSLRFKLLDGNAEKTLLGLGEEGQNINTKLLARNLQQFIGGNWVKVESFKSFNSLAMSRIRKVVGENDREYDGITVITNPRTGDSQPIPLMTIPSFFYPLGISL